MSVIKALEHSAFRCRRKLEIRVILFVLLRSFTTLIMLRHLQWVEASDLEPETQESHPVNYHDAWRIVVGAQYVSYLEFRYRT